MDFLMTETKEDCTESMLDAWMSWLKGLRSGTLLHGEDAESLPPEKVKALARMTERMGAALTDIRTHCQNEGHEPGDTIEGILEILHKLDYSWSWEEE